MDELLKLLASLKATDEQIKEAKALFQASLDESIEEEVAGLKTKNSELLLKLKKARTASPDTAELEAKLDELEVAKTEALQKAERAEKAREKAEKDFTAKLETESAAVRRMVVDQGLTAGLSKLGVKAEHAEAVRALLAGKVEIVTEGEARVAKVEGKALEEYLTAWAATPTGKAFVPARASGGGSTQPGEHKDAAGALKRDQFVALAPEKQLAHIEAGGTVED